MTSRYFVGDKNDINLNDLILNKDSVEDKSKSNKIIKKWVKKDNNFDRKLFSGNSVVSEEKLKKYKRGNELNISEALSHKKYRKRLLIEEKKKQNSVRFAARSELLLPEESGYLEADDNEKTYQITQKEIVNSVDITSATKHFDLNLEQLGPYYINYYRNGRNLLIGGKGGHVAAIDWITKDLICEFNVQESVHDIQWLHMPTMFAVAQKDWVYIYDNKGIQIHCLKKLYRVYKLDFLPYHFLLVSASDNGYLSWLDVSMGKMVSNFKMKCPRLTTMKQNPYNAVIATGHPNGTVNMWSPNQKEALVSMLCHPSAIRDVAFDERGLFMATAGVDRALRIWDIRNLKCLQNYKLRSVPSHIDISQRNLLAVSTGNVVEIYNQCFRQTVDTPYMRHRLNATVSGLEFCNYEDVLGIGHQKGFTSIIIPGSGEPNFDAFESNPYMTTAQRREMEVKSLLDKIQPELITLDPMILGTVDTPSLQQQINDKQSVRYVKPKSIEFEAKRKKRMKTAKKAKVKKGLQQQQKRKEIKEIVKEKNKKSTEKVENKHVLDRFKPKN